MRTRLSVGKRVRIGGGSVLNKMQKSQSRTILWEEGRWASPWALGQARNARVLEVLSQAHGTQRGVSV